MKTRSEWIWQAIEEAKKTTTKRRGAKGGGEVQINEERERAMMRELAEFIFGFGEKYDVLLDVKVKPRKHRKGGTGDERD